ncbi:oxidative damage protection protein [Alkalimarinus coralli]|uniref:oxidative damage protection protein n=1 Tax=Alkalimarinus coralli TaxID=2935863 RepID=UPI00202B8EA4|nr:oxidative damage protection protein [Alkalimarinus coralli]
MSRMVLCAKYKEELEGLDTPPMPGQKGAYIYENISKKAWTEWQSKQTMLINEKRLNMMDPASRAYLAEQMENFFNNKETDVIEGYVPENK